MEVVDHVSRNKMNLKRVIVTFLIFQLSANSAPSVNELFNVEGPKHSPIDLQAASAYLRTQFSTSKTYQTVEVDYATNISPVPNFMNSKQSRLMFDGDCFKITSLEFTPLNEITNLERELKDTVYACSYDLYSLDYEISGETKKINIDQYCGCVERTTKKKKENFSLPSDSFEAFKNKSYPNIIASRVHDLFKLIESNSYNFEEYAKQYHVENGNELSFSCTKKDISKISKKISSCFNKDVVSAIDEKIDFSVDQVGGLYKDAKVRSRLEHIFNSSSDHVDKFFAEQEVFSVDKVDSAVNLFYHDFINREDFGLLQLDDEYLDKVRTFIKNKPEFRNDFYSYRQKAINEADEDNRIRYYQSNGKTGTLNYKGRDFTKKDEYNFVVGYLSTFNMKFLQTAIDEFKSEEEANKFLNELRFSNDYNSINKANSLFNKTVNSSNKDLIDECQERIEALEFACNPENIDSVMEEVSAVEFTKVNENFGGQDIFAANYYCGAIGERIDEKVAGSFGKVYRSTADTTAIFNDIESTYTEKVASYSRSSGNNVATMDVVKKFGNQNDLTNSTSTATQQSGFDQTADMLANNLNKEQNPSQQLNNQNHINAIAAQNSIQEVPQSVKETPARVENEKIVVQESFDDSKADKELNSIQDGLRQQIRELQNQVAQFSKNALEGVTDNSNHDKKVKSSLKDNNTQDVTSYNPFQNFIGSGGHLAAGGSTQGVQVVRGSGASSSSAPSAHSFSNSSTSSNAINSSAGANSIRLSSNSTTSDSIKLDDKTINSQDRNLVHEALQNGSNLVVLANGVTYFIDHDEDGNVILSESSNELKALAFSSFMGPPIPVAVKSEQEVAGRSIASEPLEEYQEESIYSKFLNAAEAVE